MIHGLVAAIMAIGTFFSGGAHATTFGATIFSPFQGGTGTSSPSGILYGSNSGSTALKSVVMGTGMAFSGGTLSSTVTGTVTNVATTYPIQGGPITTTGTISFPATSTLYGTCSSGQVIGWTNGLLACVSTSTPAASGVTSIAFGDALNGGTITTSGSVNLKSYFATSTADTIGFLMYAGSTNGWPAKVAYVATSTQTYSVAFSTTGTQGADVGGTSGTRSSVIQPSFTVTGTSTGAGTFAPILGTTTIPLQQLILGETVNGVRCRTDVGTVNVQFGNGSASTTVLNASTTNNFNAFTANNTPTAGQQFSVDIGTPASSPTKVNCTVKLTI